jgi:EmrB/QacA subfamily drug resistance transporter
MALAVVIIANDFTALSVALPAIERDLDSDLSTVQWVINGYALVFGVLIVTGGRLADMLGRRRVFVAGAGVFAAFSLLGGAAQDDLWLIACRALMGIGGALMWPAILGMTYDVLPQSRAALAGALIIGAAGFGNAIGPMLGGLLTDELSWRWIFLLNVPIAAFGVAATLASIPPDHPAATRDRLDTTGVVLLSGGLVCLLLALDQSSDWGWSDARVLGLGGLAVVLLAAFVLAERRAGALALVPGEVMASRDFAGACAAVLLMSAVFFATLLYLPQFMTRELGWSAVRSGVGMLPLMGTFALVSFAAAPLYGRIGPKAAVSGGAACIALGTVLLSRLDAGDRYGALVPGMLVLGAGIGLFYSSVTTAGVTALDPARTSLAGGIIYMFQIAGGSVGLGLNTAIVTAAGLTGDDLVTGIGHALRVDAVLALAGFAVAVVFVGGRLGPVPHTVRRHVHRAHP